MKNKKLKRLMLVTLGREVEGKFEYWANYGGHVPTNSRYKLTSADSRLKFSKKYFFTLTDAKNWLETEGYQEAETVGMFTYFNRREQTNDSSI